MRCLNTDREGGSNSLKGRNRSQLRNILKSGSCRFLLFRGHLLILRYHLFWRLRKQETVPRDMTQFFTVGTSRRYPGIIYLNFHNLSTLSYKFNHAWERL